MPGAPMSSSAIPSVATAAAKPTARCARRCWAPGGPGLRAIVCIGETRAQREDGTALAVVAGQLAASLPPGALGRHAVVAYEPVWAIGTGLTPTLADIAEIHASIRASIPAGTRILYGGSMNPRNAAEILALADVGGGLIGGASLKAEDFWAIVEAAR